MIHRQLYMRETGAALNVQRVALGLTQDELAAGIGVHRSVVSRWEKGERMVSGWDLAVLKEFLDLVAERVKQEVANGHER